MRKLQNLQVKSATKEFPRYDDTGKDRVNRKNCRICSQISYEKVLLRYDGTAKFRVDRYELLPRIAGAAANLA